MNIIIAILIFGFLIIFHELGHFLAAKYCQIKVNEFSLGLGPTLVGKTIGETKFSLKLLPLGGACMMEGEDEESEDLRSFNKKKLWQRALVVFMGPCFNFILAFLLALILLGNAGVDEPVIDAVTADSPAEEAGIEAGDRIVKMNRYPVHFYREISLYCFFHQGETLDITVERGDSRIHTSVTPRYNKEYDRYMIGVQSTGERTHGGFLSVLKAGVCEIKYQIYVVFKSLAMLFTGQVSLNEMTGPVGIVKTIGDTVESSTKDGIYYVVMNMISITVLLSANLGVMNLLPIPALDGGRLFFFLIEAIRRKKMDEELEGRIHFAGFALLMGLMIVIFFNDIRRLFM